MPEQGPLVQSIHLYTKFTDCYCLVPFDPRDYSPLGSSVPGTLQARRLEWVAISSSRGSS